MLKLWVLKLMPFAHRWFDAAPAACCGMCGTCITAAASGLTIEAMGNLRREGADAGGEPAS